MLTIVFPLQIIEIISCDGKIQKWSFSKNEAGKDGKRYLITVLGKLIKLNNIKK